MVRRCRPFHFVSLTAALNRRRSVSYAAPEGEQIGRHVV
jgi:hypothetical protein